MIDITILQKNPHEVAKAIENKGITFDVFHVLEIYEKKKELQKEVQILQEKKNVHTSGVSGQPSADHIAKGKEIKNSLDQKEHALRAVEEELETWTDKMPNLAKEDVKVGKNESENDVIKTYKTPLSFTFPVKDHVTLGEELDIIDTKRAAKVSGTRFGYLKKEGALLEYALLQLGYEILLQEGFIPIIPPVLIKKDVMKALGYMEQGGEEDMFHIPQDNLVLVGTAEHSLVPMHAGETFEKNELPKRYMAYSPAFRRESGSYGKDTRGILRVHQFNKLEMVSFTTQEEDTKEHEYLLSLEEKLFQLLDIPYQVVKMCTGDLGFPAARKYDIEVWIPSEKKYREVTSVSTTTDFQSRRLQIKYKDGNEKKYVSILNGTAFSMNRPLIAILENYQQQDGSVAIPSALHKYLPFTIISKKNT